jgi:AcrR family transcriptional regulator
MPRTRARTDEAKQERRERLLDAARELFERQTFEEISMDGVARKAGVSKGTLYVYFPTREVLFLELLEREATRWFDALHTALVEASGAEMGAEDFADRFVATLRHRPVVVRLFAILHVVLEQNITLEAARSFKLFLRESLLRLARAAAPVLGLASNAHAAQLLLRIYTYMIGLYPMAYPSPAVAEAMRADPRLEIMRLEFEPELLAVIPGMVRQAREMTP